MSLHLLRALAGMTMAAALCGCADHRQASINDAYAHGSISYARKERLTNDLALKRQTALDEDIRWQQEHSIPQDRKDRDAYQSFQREDHEVYDPNGMPPSP
jgi:hypothetical protein